MSDLDNFIKLYKSIGIDLKVTETKDMQEVVLTSNNLIYGDADKYTFSDKFDGYSVFYSLLTFDKKGNFIKQGVWE